MKYPVLTHLRRKTDIWFHSIMVIQIDEAKGSTNQQKYSHKKPTTSLGRKYLTI